MSEAPGAAGVESMVKLWTRARSLRRDEHGGVLVVMAFAIIAVSVMAGLSSIAITSGMTAMNQRAAQSAEAGMRSAIGTVLAEVNSGNGAKNTIDGLKGRTFASAPNGPVQVKTTIESARYDGQSVHLDVFITSKGRVQWTRKGTATLNLAYATSLARIVDGRAVWDYAAQSNQNDYSEQVVALWTAGEMTVYDPASGTSKPVTPNQATIAKSLTGETATFTAAKSGSCADGQQMLLQTRFKQADKAWAAWAENAAASIALSPGQQATFEARTACKNAAGERSTWAVQSASILRAVNVPNAPNVAFNVDENGDTTVIATSNLTPTAGVQVTEQVRVRLDGGAWSSWSTSNTVTLPLRAGQTVEAQGRVRVLTSTDDSGWIESGVATQTFRG